MKNTSLRFLINWFENNVSGFFEDGRSFSTYAPNYPDLVDKLTINYNRSRQASITKELIEIISGAESL